MNVRSKTPPNCVLIVMDTTRAASLSCYGCDDRTTPHLDRFADDGVLYEQAIAPAPWTVPSHVSLFTGLFPSSHGIDGDRIVLGEDANTLASMLGDVGFETLAVTNNPWVSDSFGLTRGFDSVVRTWQMFQEPDDPLKGLRVAPPSTTPRWEQYRKVLGLVLHGNIGANVANAVYAKVWWRRKDDGAARTNREVGRWLRSRKNGQPFLLFLNYMEAHAPYTPPPGRFAEYLPSGVTRARVEKLGRLSRESKRFHLGEMELGEEDFRVMLALYHAEISYLDEKLGELFEGLKAAVDWDRTFVAVVSDHGENIGDHGLMGHCFSLHDTLVRVPMIVKYPRGMVAPYREHQRVQLVDLLPTILDVIDAPDHLRKDVRLEGASLLRLKGYEDRLIVSEYPSVRYTPEARDLGSKFGGSKYDRQLYAVYRGSMKLIIGSDGRHELYDIERDPWERLDVAREQPASVARMMAEFEQWRQGRPKVGVGEELSGGEVDGVVEARLRDFGYL